MPNTTKYTEENIRSLDWKEHIRLRPGMYIGKLGDGSSQDDGIYVLVKEIIDNSIDEHVMGFGKTIDLRVTDRAFRLEKFLIVLPKSIPAENTILKRFKSRLV